MMKEAVASASSASSQSNEAARARDAMEEQVRTTITDLLKDVRASTLNNIIRLTIRDKANQTVINALIFVFNLDAESQQKDVEERLVDAKELHRALGDAQVPDIPGKYERPLIETGTRKRLLD